MLAQEVRYTAVQCSRGPNKAVSLYKAVSRYKAVKIVWSDRGIALIKWNESGGFPLQGGHTALAHTTTALLGDRCCNESTVTAVLQVRVHYSTVTVQARVLVLCAS